IIKVPYNKKTKLENKLPAGPSTIAVTDNNGCTFTAAAVTVNNTGGPTDVVVTPTDASCGADNGTVTVGAVTGGAAPYTYSINGKSGRETRREKSQTEKPAEHTE